MVQLGNVNNINMKYLLIMLTLAIQSCTELEENPITEIRDDNEDGLVEVDCMPEDLQRILEEYPRAIIVKFYDQSGNE